MVNDTVGKIILEGQVLSKSEVFNDSKMVIQRMKKAQESFSKKSFDDTINECREILKIYPKYFDCHYLLANSLREKGLYDDAISEYLIVLTVRPHADIYDDLGICYICKNEYNAAARAFTNALKLKNSPYFKNNLSSVIEKLGLQPKEISDFISQVPRFFNIAEIHVSIGDFLYKRSVIDDAMSEYMEAINLKPDNIMAHDGLGNCFFRKKDYNSALEEYNCTILQQPDFADGHYHLGNTYFCLEKIDEAIKEYIESIYRSPKNINAHYYLGKCYYKKGRIDEAIMEYRKTGLSTQLGAEFFYDLGRALSDKGLINDAINEYKKSIKMKPDYKDALIEINRLIQQQTKTKK
jgi:tetratricopeptide (TPR) repeat protein